MNDTIIVAIITGTLSLIGTLAGSYFPNRKTTAVISQHLTDLVSDLEKLEKKVEKHNNLVERMVAVESSTRSAHHRIDRIDKIIDSMGSGKH